MTDNTQEVNSTFMNYFKKHRGVYSYNDVEQIVKEELEAHTSHLAEEIALMRKGTFKTDARTASELKIFGHIEGYNMALGDILALLQPTKEKEGGLNGSSNGN